MAGDPQDDGRSPDAVHVPFLFVPHGEAPPPGWLAAHPDAIKIPATFVPRDSAGRMGDNAPRPSDRFGNPLRPFSDYGPDERAPGQGPPDATPGIPDLDAAVATYLKVHAAIRPATGGLPGQSAPGRAAAGSPAGFPSGTITLADDTAQAPPEQSGSSQHTMPPESRDVGIHEHDPAAPVPLVDDQGRPVLDKDGSPILRPAGLDPHMVVVAGEADRERLAAALALYGYEREAVLGAMTADALHLLKFRRGHSWDAQRIGGQFDGRFVDYAIIEIGLYADSAGISRDDILYIENLYAQSGSRYPNDTKMDTNFGSLPRKNVENTDIGYGLYQSGQIGTGINYRSSP